MRSRKPGGREVGEKEDLYFLPLVIKKGGGQKSSGRKHNASTTQPRRRHTPLEREGPILGRDLELTHPNMNIVLAKPGGGILDNEDTTPGPRWTRGWGAAKTLSVPTVEERVKKTLHPLPKPAIKVEDGAEKSIVREPHQQGAP